MMRKIRVSVTVKGCASHFLYLFIFYIVSEKLNIQNIVAFIYKTKEGKLSRKDWYESHT